MLCVRHLGDAQSCDLVQVEIKTTKEQTDTGLLQKAADYVHAYLLGVRHLHSLHVPERFCANVIPFLPLTGRCHVFSLSIVDFSCSAAWLLLQFFLSIYSKLPTILCDVQHRKATWLLSEAFVFVQCAVATLSPDFLLGNTRVR